MGTFGSWNPAKAGSARALPASPRWRRGSALQGDRLPDDQTEVGLGEVGDLVAVVGVVAEVPVERDRRDVVVEHDALGLLEEAGLLVGIGGLLGLGDQVVELLARVLRVVVATV